MTDLELIKVKNFGKNDIELELIKLQNFVKMTLIWNILN